MQESLRHQSASTSGEKNSSQLAHSTTVEREEISGQQICSKYQVLLIMFSMKLFCTVFTFFLDRAGHQLRPQCLSGRHQKRVSPSPGTNGIPLPNFPQISSMPLRKSLISVPLRLDTCKTHRIGDVSHSIFPMCLAVWSNCLKGKNFYKTGNFKLSCFLEKKNHFQTNICPKSSVLFLNNCSLSNIFITKISICIQLFAILIFLMETILS